MTMFALVDCNNFFASCERLFRPDLQQAPIIVLSNNDGCVIARSNEAKALGIGMGVPFFKVKALCQQYKIQVFSSNYALYGDLSERVMAVIQEAWEETEIYSVDEAFLNLQTLSQELREPFCRELQQKILQATGIPTSIGIGLTKTLAKAANTIAKKQLKVPVFHLTPDSHWLKQLEIGEVWGVGRKWQKKLWDLGIHSAFDLSQRLEHARLKKWNICLLRTILELNGQACLELSTSETSQSILSSRSFGSLQTEYQALREAVSYHCSIAWEKLRAQELKTKRISVFAYTQYLSEQYYSHSASITLLHPSDDICTITQLAERCLHQFYQSVPYKKCGVVFHDLSDKQIQQYDLFTAISEEEQAHCEKIMQTIEAINDKYKTKTLYLAAEGIKKSWSMKRALKTPNYTTKWTELPVVYAR